MASRNRQSVKGDNNEQVEQLSHNRIMIEGGQALSMLTVFAMVLVTGSIALVAIVHWALFESLIVASFVGFFVCGWIIAISLTVRHVSATRTAIECQASERDQAHIKADIIHATDHYILWRDPDGSYQFRGSTVITENRQFLPQLPAPKDATQGILECWDQGMSGRAIEKHLKDGGVTYRQIQKVLNVYRPDWNRKGTVDADLVDAEE